MNINIEINDDVIKKAALDLIAEDISNQFRANNGYPAMYITNREVKEVIRELLKDRLDVLADKAVNAAAKSIGIKAARKLPVTANWVTGADGMPKCSNCGYNPAYDTALDDFFYSGFCPNCGARMDGANYE